MLLFQINFQGGRNYGYTGFYNIMSLFHLPFMDESAEFHIPYQKNSMYLSDRFDNILTYIERKYLRGRPFTKFQPLDISIRRILPRYKTSSVEKDNNCFQLEHDKVNDITFELELQNLVTTC